MSPRFNSKIMIYKLYNVVCVYFNKYKDIKGKRFFIVALV